jgi:Dockerin type I domain/Beta-propeller repeat
MHTHQTFRTCVAALAGLVASAATAVPAFAAFEAPADTRAALQSHLAAMPLRFEPAADSTDERFDFIGRGAGYGLFIGGDDNGFVVRSSDDGKTAVVTMRMVGANRASQASGQGPLPSRSNFYRGSDPSRWSAGVANYESLRYADIYRGVDVVFYGNQRQLEYDFIVAPETDLKVIELAFDGVTSVALDDAGRLVLSTEAGPMIQQAPVVHQVIDGGTVAVNGWYELRGGNRVGFGVGPYDTCLPLVIDPIVNYSTLFGGNSADEIYDLAVDSLGQILVCGYTASSTFPDTLPGSLQGFWDMFVAKFNASGTGLVYSTYLSAGIGVFDIDVREFATGIAVDADGFAYVVGNTNATDFPMLNALQPQSGGGYDAVILKLSPTGQLVFSTYFGGSGKENQGVLSSTRVGAITVDGTGSIYIAGTSNSANFPLMSPFDGVVSGSSCPGTCIDVFLTKMSNDGQTLLYSTFIGGTLPEEPVDIRIDSQQQVHLVVNTDKVLIHKVRADGSGLLYTAELDNGPDGGSVLAHSFDVDADGRVHVGGTTSSGSFPTTPGVWQETHGGSFDGHVWQGFVTVFSPDGSAIERSTYLGDTTANETVTAIGVDSHGNVICGVNKADHIGSTTINNHLWKLDAALAERSVFMHIAGSGQATELEVDSQNNIRYAGWVWAGSLPTVTPGAFQVTGAGNKDGFVTWIDMQDPPLPEPVPADLNGDGVVNGLDLAMLLAAWGPCPARGGCAPDLDGNGVVNGLDLAMLLAVWGLG